VGATLTIEANAHVYRHLARLAVAVADAHSAHANSDPPSSERSDEAAGPHSRDEGECCRYG